MEQGLPTFSIDGDLLRKHHKDDLGFSVEDRSKNVLRAMTLAKKKLDEGYIVIVALISPFFSDRALARELLAPQFKEVYINTPLSTCEKRDPKGLYKKIRAGLIRDMSGIDSPYEVPLDPDMIIDSLNLTPNECVQIILAQL
jgi:adenylyl-sulfate kinase